MISGFLKTIHLIVFILLTLPGNGQAAGGPSIPLKEARVNFQDKLSLQRGAQIYINNCLGCHSLKYMRYERLVEDLGISTDLVVDNLIFDDSAVGSQIRNAMNPDHAKQWFGVTPPDLTLQSRLKGADWLYSYLVGFYADDSRPLGVNNYYFSNVGMPHVLSGMERELGADKFSDAMHDLTNFLTYTADPTKLQRERIGRWVLAFLFIFLIPVWLLNREYWKDVH